MTTTLREIDWLGFPAIRLEAGALAATLLPAVGGRVIALEIDGLDVFWHDPRLEEGPAATTGGPRPVWWGGWKTWIAPQARWPGGLPPRDLDEGSWVRATWTDADATPIVRMASPVCRDTGLEVVREVSLDGPTSSLRVRATVRNPDAEEAALLGRAAGAVDAGIWEVIQIRKPAHVAFPVDRGAFVEERGVHSFAEEKGSAAARERVLRLVDDAAGRHAEVRCSTAPLRFKLGARTPPGLGRVRAVMPERGGRALKLLFDAPPGAPYAHGASPRAAGSGKLACDGEATKREDPEGVNVEVFGSDEAPYCEIEAHAPLAALRPGESVTATFTLEATQKKPGRSGRPR